MDRQEGLDLLREVVSDVLSRDPDGVTEASRFREDLDADSLDLIEIVSALEDRVDVQLPDDELKEVKTIGDALDLMMDENNWVSVGDV